LDRVTPPSWAAEARRTLSNAFYFEFPGQDHVVIQQPLSATSGCPAQITRAFLDDPTRAPDGTCIRNVYHIHWVLPE
jgi:hypothetical protein